MVSDSQEVADAVKSPAEGGNLNFDAGISDGVCFKAAENPRWKKLRINYVKIGPSSGI